MAKIDEKKAIILIAAIGGTITLGALAGVYFTYDEIDAKEEAIQAAKTQLQDSERKIAQIPKLEDDVIVLRENVDTYTRILPDTKEVGDFTRTLNGFASQVGITIENWLPQKEQKPKGKFTNYSYKLKTKASTWQLLRFMSLIENHERFMKISALQLRSTTGTEILIADAEEGVIHDIDMTVETYVYNGKGSGQNVDIPNFKVKRERLLDRIQSVADAVALERYEYTEQPGRRDIFIDPRPLVGRSAPDQGLRISERELGELESRMDGLRIRFGSWESQTNYLQRERMRRELLAELDEIWSSGKDMASEVGSEQARSRLNSSVLIPAREMIAELRGMINEENAVTLDMLDTLITQIRQDAANGDYQTAIDRFDEVAPQLGFAEDDPRRELADQALKIRDALEITLEFEQIPLQVEGWVVYDAGRRGLLINGSALEEGDMVTPEVMLLSVRKGEADFVYRDLLLTKRW
ncbi:MAG: type 4a pilus biogenesis protein PilO [Planctomycetota bacterium]